MKCEELLRMLNDYVDGDLDPGLCAEFEKHFEGCDPCRIVVDTVRQTIRLYRGEEVCEIPLDFRKRLHAALYEKWKQVRPASGQEPPPKAP